MAARILKGGKTITVNPDLLQFPLYGETPKARVEWPGTIQGNVAAGVLTCKAAEKRIGTPDPTWVKVVVRELEGELLFVLIPVPVPANPEQPPPDTYPLKLQKNVKKRAHVIRGLKRLVKEARLDMRPDTWYEMTMEAGEDEGGAVVLGSWTKAKAHPITQRETEQENGEESAAGAQ